MLLNEIGERYIEYFLGIVNRLDVRVRFKNYILLQ